MNSILSSIVLWIAGLLLMLTGIKGMTTRGASEVDGSSSLIAENIRSTGSQSFGLGIGFVGLGCAPLRRKPNSPED
jgi:hypothetical protein